MGNLTALDGEIVWTWVHDRCWPRKNNIISWKGKMKLFQNTIQKKNKFSVIQPDLSNITTLKRIQISNSAQWIYLMLNNFQCERYPVVNDYLLLEEYNWDKQVFFAGAIQWLPIIGRSELRESKHLPPFQWYGLSLFLPVEDRLSRNC